MTKLNFIFNLLLLPVTILIRFLKKVIKFVIFKVKENYLIRNGFYYDSEFIPFLNTTIIYLKKCGKEIKVTELMNMTWEEVEKIVKELKEE